MIIPFPGNRPRRALDPGTGRAPTRPPSPPARNPSGNSGRRSGGRGSGRGRRSVWVRPVRSSWLWEGDPGSIGRPRRRSRIPRVPLGRVLARSGRGRIASGHGIPRHPPASPGRKSSAGPSRFLRYPAALDPPDRQRRSRGRSSPAGRPTTAPARRSGLDGARGLGRRLFHHARRVARAGRFPPPIGFRLGGLARVPDASDVDAPSDRFAGPGNRLGRGSSASILFGPGPRDHPAPPPGREPPEFRAHGSRRVRVPFRSRSTWPRWSGTSWPNFKRTLLPRAIASSSADAGLPASASTGGPRPGAVEPAG